MNQKNQCLISVIVPLYNHEEYINETIDSILDQSVTDLELIIIDDNSNDNGLLKVKEYKDSRIKIIELKNNLGFCKASNLAIKEAKGKYLSIIASDDVMRPDNLFKKIDFLEKNKKYGAVFSFIDVIDENSKVSYKKTKKYNKILNKDFNSCDQWLNYFYYNGNCIAAPTMIVRSSIIKKINFNELMPQAHDFNMWVNFCLAGHNLFVIKEKLVKYRQFKKLTSLSSNNERMRKRLIFDQEKILENFLKISDPKKFKKIFSNISFKENKIDLLLFELALDTINNYKDKFSHYQFSLNYIYKYLLNLKTRKEVEENYGFGVNDLYKIIEFNPIGVLSEKANQKPLYRRVLKRLSKLPFGFKNIIYS